MFAYGISGDVVDEYMSMSDSTCIEAMYRCCQTVIDVFHGVYLRDPTVEYTT
jgi:hypothetical protein